MNTLTIAISRQPLPKEKAWGGGNVILSAIVETLEKRGHTIHYDQNRACDVIFLFDPRDLIFFREDSLTPPIVTRCGDLGTHGKPILIHEILKATRLSTNIVFPSDYAYSYMLNNSDLYKQTDVQDRVTVLPNVPDDTYFRRKSPKVVTHHWSDNPKKGKEDYEKLQELVHSWDFKFTFIGRPCFSVNYDNTKVIPPLSKDKIADELRKHDYYITASEEEAGANHVLEAMACNLPILHNGKGGSIPEYIGPYIHYDEIEDLRPLLDRWYFPRIDELAQRYANLIQDAAR